MGKVQSSIDIYLSQETYERVEATFPYMVDKTQATGGGEVATVHFHIFDKTGLPDLFYIDELPVIPIPVQHGTFSNGQPFYCMGFRFHGVTYISDTNFIPESSKERIRGSTVLVIDALKS
jgi:phosphoribosyl 1,2-cyclic phosphodiesterase